MVLHDKVEDARRLEDKDEVMMVPSQENTTMMVEMADVISDEDDRMEDGFEMEMANQDMKMSMVVEGMEKAAWNSFKASARSLGTGKR